MVRQRDDGDERQPRLTASAVIMAGCCVTSMVIALFVPVARAQLIVTALPGAVAIAAVLSRPPDRQ